jgi:secondary thiamine-phosphate synthase enzyme
MLAEFSFSTSKKQEFVDINSKIDEFISKAKVNEGICTVFCRHATAAIVINENHDPNICLDILEALDKLIPAGKWRHDRIDGNADAHIKASILGPHETVPIKNNKLLLGRWQSIMFVELDGPRPDRKVVVQIR